MSGHPDELNHSLTEAGGPLARPSWDTGTRTLRKALFLGIAIRLLTASPHASTIIDHPTTASVAQSGSISGTITSGSITG